MKNSASPILRAALNREFGPTAFNFALSVTARQVAFKLSSKGFATRKQTSDTNGAPKSDEAPMFDCALDTLPGVDFTEKAKPFPTEVACEVYGMTLLMLSETLHVPLEYGRTPDDGPDGLRKYWSTPGQWATEKARYLKSITDREAAELGATYGATADAIAVNQKAKADETNARLAGIAKNMSQLINHAVKVHATTDTASMIDFIEENLPELGLTGDAELKGAAEALFKIRKAAYERGEKSSAPQPGLLAMFKQLGVVVGK
jgi:hypothetical protein